MNRCPGKLAVRRAAAALVFTTFNPLPGLRRARARLANEALCPSGHLAFTYFRYYIIAVVPLLLLLRQLNSKPGHVYEAIISTT